MEIYKDKISPILDKICSIFKLEQLNRNESLKKIAQSTGLQPSHLVLILSALLVLLSILNVGSSLICNMVGFIYPAYMSFKALESHGIHDDKQWLTYWIVYSLFTVMDSFFGYVLSFIPVYYLVKLLFFVYLFHPSTKGAAVIYDIIVHPVLRKYENYIDDQLRRFGRR